MRTPPHATIIVYKGCPIKIMKLLLEHNNTSIKWKALKKTYNFHVNKAHIYSNNLNRYQFVHFLFYFKVVLLYM